MTLDIDMPVMNGIDALKEIVRVSTASVIMVSARTEQGAAITLEALAIGAVDFIPKSNGVERIHDKLLAAVEAKSHKTRTLAARPASVMRPSGPTARERLARASSAKICIIGSSTGGPQALQSVLTQLPDNLPVPVVVAQHMPPNFTKALAQRLNDTCKPKVVEAEDGAAVGQGHRSISPRRHADARDRDRTQGLG